MCPSADLPSAKSSKSEVDFPAELSEIERDRSILEAIQAQANVGGWELELQTGKLFWSSGVFRILEIDPEGFDLTVEAGMDYFPLESQAILAEAIEKAKNTGEGYDLELDALTAKGRPIEVRSTCQVTSEAGRPLKFIGTFQDITEAKKAEAALRASEEFAVGTLDALPTSICVLDESGVIISVNKGWEEFADGAGGDATGVGENYLTVCDAVKGKEAAIAATVATEIRRVIRGEKESYAFDYPCDVESRTHWFTARVSGFKQDGRLRPVVSHTDITVQKNAELELEESQDRLRGLTLTLQRAEEKESRRIAGVVHDELGQELTGLKMDLRSVEKFLEKGDAAAIKSALARTRQASELIDTTIETVQRISSALRPVILDQLGLWPALREQVRVFGRRSSLACQVSLPSKEPPVDEASSTACFRIVQEALTNITRHAKASRVVVRVWIEHQQLIMLVEDDGGGIDLQKVAHHNSIGLFGMRERARQLGGLLSISRLPTGGTSVRAEFPVNVRTDEGGQGE